LDDDVKNWSTLLLTLGELQRGKGSKSFFGIPKANSYGQVGRQARFFLHVQVFAFKAKKVTKGYYSVKKSLLNNFS
jgi:hypothetical protein